jgi:hypothetical protein
LAAGVGRTAAAGSTAAGMGAGEARERAVEAGATPEQITSATQAGIIPGIAELLPIERIFRIMPKEIKGGIFDRLQRALVTGGMEGLQEGASAIAQNLIAQQVYKPSQELIEKVGEDAAYGAGAGALVQFMVDAVAGRRAKPAAAGQPPVAETPQPEQPPGQPLEQAQPVAAQSIPTGAQQPLFEPLPAGEVPPVTGMAPSGARYSAERFAEDEAQGADADLASVLMERDELLRVKGIMEREFQRALTREEAVSRRLDIESIDAQLKDVNKRISSIEKQPTKRDQQKLAKMQGQLDLQEPSEPAPEEPAVSEPATPQITPETLIGLGFSPITAKTSKFSKKLQALDLTNPDDIDMFEELVRVYRNQYPNAKKPTAAAVKRFIEQARFRQAEQTELFPEVANDARSEAAGESVGVPVLGPDAGGPGVAADGAPAVARGEGPATAPVSRAEPAPNTLSDVEEVETAYDVANTTKSKREYDDAVTYLSFFANDSSVGPTAKLAARKYLADLGDPKAEVQAAYENIAISEASGQQERNEDASLEASKKTQRNIGDQLKRELDKTPRKPRAKTEQQLVEAQAQKTAFEQSEELNRVREWQTLEMPPELNWVTTPADTRRLMQSYFDDYNAQQEATKREVEEKGTKRRLSAAERKKLRENEQLEALGMSKETVADIYKLGKRATPPKFTAIKLGVNDVDPKAMAEIDSLMEQARKTDAPAARKSLRDTAYRQLFAAIRDTKNRVVTQQSTSEFDRLMRRGATLGCRTPRLAPRFPKTQWRCSRRATSKVL